MNIWVRAAIALIVFAAITAGATLLSTSLFSDAKQTRITAEESDSTTVDSIYDDRVESRFDPDYDRNPYRAIAEELQSDPVYVDDYLAFEIDTEALDTIRQDLVGLDTPIYIAFLSYTELDDVDGAADLTATRIARELGVEEANVIALNSQGAGLGSKGVVREPDQQPLYDGDDSLTDTGLKWVRSVKETEPVELYAADSLVLEDSSRSASDLAYWPGSAASGAVLGLIIGGGIALAGAAAVARLCRQPKQSESRHTPLRIDITSMKRRK